MGIQELFTLLLDKEREKTPLNMYRNQTVGIDASVFLMKWLCSSSYLGAYLMMDPPVNFDVLVSQYWDEFHRSFDTEGVNIVLVLDGSRNPAKTITNNDRLQARLAVEQRIMELVQNNNSNDADMVAKLLKSAVYIRNDIVLATSRWATRKNIPFLCAPMEADWQLVQLELSGISSASVSEDSDLLALGSKKLLINLDLKTKSVFEVDCERVIKHHGIQVIKDSHGWNHDDFIAYCILLGCDYVSRTQRLGPVTLEVVMKLWVNLTVEEKIHFMHASLLSLYAVVCWLVHWPPSVLSPN